MTAFGKAVLRVHHKVPWVQEAVLRASCCRPPCWRILVGGAHPGIRARAPGQCLVPDPQWEARTETMVGGIWQRTWGKKNPLFAATAQATSLWLLPHASGAETRSMDGKTTHIKETIPDKTSSLQPALSTSSIPIFARHWAKGSRPHSATPEGNELCASWQSPSSGLHSGMGTGGMLDREEGREEAEERICSRNRKPTNQMLFTWGLLYRNTKINWGKGKKNGAQKGKLSTQ